jgi:hypothetical protein
MHDSYFPHLQLGLRFLDKKNINAIDLILYLHDVLVHVGNRTNQVPAPRQNVPTCLNTEKNHKIHYDIHDHQHQIRSKVQTNVADPWHLVMDPDWGIRILLFSSIIFKTATKKFFLFYFFKLPLHHFSKVKSHEGSKTMEIKVFLTIFTRF